MMATCSIFISFLLLSVLDFTKVLTQEVDPCSDGWKKIGSGCYLFSKQRVTWRESFRQCAKHGAQLAIPRNTAENSALGNAANKEGLYFPWIGVSRQLNKTFTTVCGSNPSFTNWKINQPDDYAGQENCVQIIAEDTLAKWNDNVCGKKYDYICEIKIPSICASKDDKKSPQNCSSVTTIPETNTKPKPGYDRTTNSIVMFFVGAAVTLAIVLVVIFVIQIYKRRRKASKLSNSVLAVDTVELQNETAPEASQNNQELDYSPADGGTEPYEEVQISPPSVYAELDRNRQDETTNDGYYQKLLKRDSDYAIPVHTEAESSYEEVGKTKTSPGYKELDITKRQQDDGAYYQKLIKK